MRSRMIQPTAGDVLGRSGGIAARQRRSGATPNPGPGHFLKGSSKLLPVLYINLEDDAERRAHIERELAQRELKPIRVRAFEPHFAPCGGAFADTLSPGEIACYASHMKAWNTLLVSRYPYALVLEDDARVPPNLADLVEAIVEALPQRWDLVHFYDNEGRPARPLTPLGNGRKLVRYSRAPAGCVAYLISRSGAQKLSRQELRSWPLDTDFRRPWHFGVDTYGIRPMLIDHESEFSSAILRSGPRSRRRRGIRLSSPLHSLQGAMWNMRMLGLGGGFSVSQSIADDVASGLSANCLFSGCRLLLIRRQWRRAEQPWRQHLCQANITRGPALRLPPRLSGPVAQANRVAANAEGAASQLAFAAGARDQAPRRKVVTQVTPSMSQPLERLRQCGLD
jgi:glycosyl transferase, family 25